MDVITEPLTQKQLIGKILSSDDWDSSTKWVVKWQFGLLGDFQAALAAAITRADDSNLELLFNAFPVQVNGYRRWALGMEPSISPALRAAGLEI